MACELKIFCGVFSAHYTRDKDLCKKVHAKRSCNRCFGPFQRKNIPLRKFRLQICIDLCDLNKADFASDVFVEIFAFLDNHGNLRVPKSSGISPQEIDGLIFSG